MRRIIVFEIALVIFMSLLGRYYTLADTLGLLLFLVLIVALLAIRGKLEGKSSEYLESNNHKKFAFTVLLNDVCLVLAVYQMTSYLLPTLGIEKSMDSLAYKVFFVVNKFIMPWWVMVDLARFVTRLRVRNVLVIFIIYMILGYLAAAGFDYMTTAVVLIYAFTSGFLQTKRGEEFKKDYGLGFSEKYEFVDVDFLLAIIFLSYLMVKATGVSSIFTEIDPRESQLLSIIERSLWDGGIMMILSTILMYVLLKKGFVYRIYDVIDRFLRGVAEDLMGD